MGAFQYVAVDPRGKEQKGVLEGDSPRHVRQLLRERALMPLQIDEVESRARKRTRSFSLRKNVGGLDLAIITRQLATLVRAGLPLDEALQAASQQTEKPRLKSIILGVRAKVLEGHTLAAGLDDFPQAFPPVYRATVAAGEQAGQLDLDREVEIRLGPDQTTVTGTVKFVSPGVDAPARAASSRTPALAISASWPWPRRAGPPACKPSPGTRW